MKDMTDGDILMKLFPFHLIRGRVFKDTLFLLKELSII